MPESEPIPRPPWEDLSLALVAGDMRVYPIVELSDGTLGTYIGAQDASNPDADLLEAGLLERFGDRLEMDYCTVQVDEEGEVTYGKKPDIISYAVRLEPRPRPAIVEADESLMQRLKGKPIVRWLFRD